jgi:YHS domain-containing protein
MGLLRLLVIAGLGYLLYRVVKSFLPLSGRLNKTRTNGVIDEMVQDPQCKTYIPRREAQRKVIDGKEYFFCGKECADKFEKEVRQ